MAHRKLKETKQQPGTAGPANMLGCCLVSFHFRCDIHPICPVDDIFTLNSIPMNKADPTSFEALKWENFPSKTDRTEPINSLLPPLPHRWSLFRSSSSSRRSARSRAEQRLRSLCVLARSVRSCVRVTDRGYADDDARFFFRLSLLFSLRTHAKLLGPSASVVCQKRERPTGYCKIIVIASLPQIAS